MQLSHFLQLPLAQLATVLNSRLMALDSAQRPTATTPHGSSSTGKRSESHDAGKLHSDQRTLKEQRMQACFSAGMFQCCCFRLRKQQPLQRQSDGTSGSNATSAAALHSFASAPSFASPPLLQLVDAPPHRCAALQLRRIQAWHKQQEARRRRSPLRQTLQSATGVA